MKIIDLPFLPNFLSQIRKSIINDMRIKILSEMAKFLVDIFGGHFQRPRNHGGETQGSGTSKDYI